MRGKILFVAGTRPEVIKVAPVVARAREQGSDVTFMLTGQHREMANQVLAAFNVEADVDLDVMVQGANLAQLTNRLIERLSIYLEEHKPDMVVVQGDTTSAAIGGLMAFYQRIDVAHIEAGLRSFNNYHPFPEEVNRKIISSYAALNFAPTSLARDNLLAESVAAGKILVTGNTVVDAANLVNARLLAPATGDKRRILVTTHRRENWNQEIEQICQALLALVEKYKDIEVLLPVHRNPVVYNQIHGFLGNKERITLTEPLDYIALHSALRDSYLVLTDSGGIQEEAPIYGVPSLVLRDVTERPEAVHAGVAKVIGTDTQKIVDETSILLDDKTAYNTMARSTNPFGDGEAARRISSALQIFLDEGPDAVSRVDEFSV